MPISVLPKRDELKVVDGRLFIDGKWVDSSGGEMWTHVNPAANEEVGRFAIATAGDVDRAVKAARRAFDEGPWPAMKARERKAILQHLVGLLYQHKDELNELQVLDNALPISFSSMYQLSAEIAADVFDHHAGWIDKITGAGSRAVGQHILEVSGKGIKRVSLELGGKSASLNFADAPSIDMAAMMAMGMVSMGLSGQGCVCQTRALVESSIYDDFINA